MKSKSASGLEVFPRIYLAAVADDLSPVAGLAASWKVGLEFGHFASPEILDSRFEAAVADCLRVAAGLPYPPVLHGPFMDILPGSLDPGVRDFARRRCEQALDAAARLGASHVVFHSGYNPMIRGPRRLERWVERSAGFWRTLLQEAGYRGDLLVENMWEPTPEPLRLLAEAVDDPRFGAALDTGHLNVFSRVEAEVWLEELTPSLAHLHLNDNHGDWDAGLAVGAGSFDFAAFFRALGRVSSWRVASGSAPAGPGVTLEVERPGDIERSVDWLANSGLARLGAAPDGTPQGLSLVIPSGDGPGRA